MTDPLDPIDVALLLTQTLDRLGVLHSIGGSVASSIAGEPRGSLDVDIVVALEERHVEGLVAALEPSFYVDAVAVQRAVSERRSVNLIHHETLIKIDLFVAGGTPLDRSTLTRRREVDIEGRRVFVHPPEDILLQKLRWFRAGGETSEKQWEDVRAIVRAQGARLDLAYLDANAEVLGVADLLARVLR